MIRSYRDLKVWERSIELAIASHMLVKKPPRSEEFGRGSQIRRAAASLPANSAEGHGRVHRGDYIHPRSMARGSLAELETHLVLAQRLSLLSSADVSSTLKLADEVSRMLYVLINVLREGKRKGAGAAAPLPAVGPPPHTPSPQPGGWD